MKLRLEFIVGQGSAERLEHEGPRVRIGRDPQGDLVFSGPAGLGISSRHAEIELGPTHATIIDCGSTNGTFVNDRRISIPTPLHVGNLIQFGPRGPMLRVVALQRPAKNHEHRVPPLLEPAETLA